MDGGQSGGCAINEIRMLSTPADVSQVFAFAILSKRYCLYFK